MICTLYKLEKADEEFAWKHRNQGIRNKVCKACHNTHYGQVWYRKNAKAVIRHKNERRKQIVKEMRLFILDYLAGHPCVDCGEDDPVVLEFDHLKDKRRAVSKMAWVGFSTSVIKAEIEKCEVRCANCHRRKSAKEQGWYRSLPKEVLDG